jgi:hypothetical protein
MGTHSHLTPDPSPKERGDSEEAALRREGEEVVTSFSPKPISRNMKLTVIKSPVGIVGSSSSVSGIISVVHEASRKAKPHRNNNKLKPPLTPPKGEENFLPSGGLREASFVFIILFITLN